MDLESDFIKRPSQILKPIYPSMFLKEQNPSEETLQKAVKEMTEYLENQIKEKVKLMYE